MKRADTQKLQAIFEKYASVEKNGERFMTHEDFIRQFLKLYPEETHNKVTVNLLGGILDTSKDG